MSGWGTAGSGLYVKQPSGDWAPWNVIQSGAGGSTAGVTHRSLVGMTIRPTLLRSGMGTVMLTMWLDHWRTYYSPNFAHQDWEPVWGLRLDQQSTNTVTYGADAYQMMAFPTQFVLHSSQTVKDEVYYLENPSSRTHYYWLPGGGVANPLYPSNSRQNTNFYGGSGQGLTQWKYDDAWAAKLPGLGSYSLTGFAIGSASNQLFGLAKATNATDVLLSMADQAHQYMVRTDLPDWAYFVPVDGNGDQMPRDPDGSLSDKYLTLEYPF